MLESLKSYPDSVLTSMQWEQKVPSVSSLRAACAQRSRRLSVIRRFVILLRWSTKAEFMKRTPKLVQITTRLKETREILGKTVASHMRFTEVIEKISRRETPGKRQVGEEARNLLGVLSVVQLDIVLMSVRRLIQHASSAGGQDTSLTSVPIQL
jgi:hypothetical protein